MRRFIVEAALLSSVGATLISGIVIGFFGVSALGEVDARQIERTHPGSHVDYCRNTTCWFIDGRPFERWFR